MVVNKEIFMCQWRENNNSYVKDQIYPGKEDNFPSKNSLVNANETAVLKNKWVTSTQNIEYQNKCIVMKSTRSPHTKKNTTQKLQH